MDFQNSVKDKHSDAAGILFTNIRYIKGDDILLSPMTSRDSAVISFTITGDHNHTGDNDEFVMYAQGLENLANFVYGGRPHWGKQNWMTVDELRTNYGKEAMDKFESLRRQLDPTDMFLNDYLQTRLVGQ